MATVYESANAKAQVTRDSSLGRMAGGTKGGKDLTLKSASSAYSVFNDPVGKGAANRSFLNSRLWHGVPQLTEEQMKMFEAAYSGHTFFFVTGLPKFMTTGMYADASTHVHALIKNFKTIVERCCVSYSGAQGLTLNTADQEDGATRKISHAINAQKEQGDIQLKLHEFAGLPVRNALEAWVNGIFDYRSQHGNYLGNLGIQGGWCLANHTMGLLVVQTDPSWTEIQDAVYYCNILPTEVPFDSFNFDKGEGTIVPDYDLTFKANEIRSEAVMKAAEAYMNNRILTMVNTAVYKGAAFDPGLKTTKAETAWDGKIN